MTFTLETSSPADPERDALTLNQLAALVEFGDVGGLIRDDSGAVVGRWSLK